MVKRTRARKLNMQGEGFMDFINGVGNFFKKTKLLSTIGSVIPIPGVQAVARVAGSLGYGVPKRKVGRHRKPGPKKGRKQRGGSIALHGVRSTNQGLVSL